MTDDARSVAAYDYELPDELIAREPAQQRDASRLLDASHGSFDDRRFAEFPELLDPGDVLVVNETQVVRARLRARLADDAEVEVLLLRPQRHARFDPAARDWLVLARPGRKLQLGTRLLFGDAASATVTDVLADGPRVIRFDEGTNVAQLMDQRGEVPLPPYVGAGDDARDARYQTIFARVPGSIAAPTASLHFTDEVFARLRARGVIVVPLVLDVGIGTFRPLQSETLDDHVMHAERYEIPATTAVAVRDAQRDGRRIVAAGTTVMRALEASAAAGPIAAGEAETSLFITPGFPFRVVDLLLTNFHLPRSTLLVLVSAFAGHTFIRDLYQTAIVRRYRFFSFGDAMLLRRAPPGA